MPPNKPIVPQLILFDLDGTLVDTAHDLGLALNMQRERHGLPALPHSDIRPYASHGSNGLLALGFDIGPEDGEFEAMRAEYLALYEQVFRRAPVMFDGVTAVLEQIESRGMRWGIVTNKPRRFTEPLLRAMNLYDRAACVVCCDDAPRAKPHPDTLLLACQQTGMRPDQAIYVGDAERDIEAGIAAGMPTVVALYGYLDQSDRPEQWGADHSIASAEELLALL